MSAGASPARRAVEALPVLLAAAMVVSATQSAGHAVALGAMVLGAALVGPRVTLSPESQHVVAGVTLVPAMAAALPFTVASQTLPRLAGGWCAAATWAVLAAASRLVMTDPVWGARATLGFGSVAALFAAWARLGPLYAGLAWAFVASCLVALRAGDRARPAAASLPARTRAASTLLVGATLGLAALSAWSLPRLYGWLQARYSRTTGDISQSGFTPWLELGPIQSMTLSDEVVLRVEGPAPSYLRGMVYDTYDRGSWRSTRAARATVAHVRRGRPEPGDTTVERVGGTPGWFFLPLDAADVGNEQGAVRRDALGVARALPGDEAVRAWFHLGARDALRVDPPAAVDLALSASLRAFLVDFAARHSDPAAPPAARLEALRVLLRTRYQYSLRVERARGLGPIRDFLTVSRAGHCEYFASAFALLGRAVGVPTRVVGGYRVAERNPFTGHHVVREKNAHAWVEAWLDGRWVTLDATPARAIPANEPHRSPLLAAVFEELGRRAARALAWATGPGSTAMMLLAGGLLVAWLAWRVWRLRDRPEASVLVGADDRPLACMDALAAALAAHHLDRAPDETLERFARRVADAPLPDPLRDDCARALRRYAALRYGGDEPEADVARAMLTAAAALREAPKPPAPRP